MPARGAAATLGMSRRKESTMTRVLIAHASKYGSVEEVARYVGAIVRDTGAACDVVPAREVERLDGYDLVVLGTGLYMTRIHRDARRFLRRHHEELTRVRFAVFAMGPLSSDKAEKDKVRPHLEHGLARYPDVVPVASEIFGGVIVPEKMSFPFNHMPAGDHRDWDEIRAFACALPLAVAVPA
jgi:menaquinone-dependent protoporphyrinogen oxidase